MLRHEHEVILRALAVLERIGQGLEAGRPPDRAVLGRLVDFFRTFADRCHHGKEEAHLFPALERHGIPKEGGPLGVMLREHEEGRALVRAMEEGRGPEVARAIRGYVILLRAHIDKENNVLLPLAEQVLPEEEQHALLRAFEEVEQAVAGPDVHERLLAELDRLEAEAG
jgi:hemerythrin-like domain-containing protein